MRTRVSRHRANQQYLFEEQFSIGDPCPFKFLAYFNFFFLLVGSPFYLLSNSIRFSRLFSSLLLFLLLTRPRFAVTPCMSRHSHLTPFFPNSLIHGGFPFSPRAAPYVVGSLERIAYARATIRRIKRLAGPITLLVYRIWNKG